MTTNKQALVSLCDAYRSDDFYDGQDSYDACLADVLTRMFEWRSIETAPKDGSRFLVYEGFEPALEAAWWNGDAVVPCSNRTHFWHEPTHWMPLPAPPETA